VPPSSGRQESVTVFLLSVRQFLVKANVFRSSPILVTLMMEAVRSSKTSVLTRATRRNIPEYGIRHCHRRENRKSYLTCLHISKGSVLKLIVKRM
jgi:hypothetical protein